jgi:hypothetical protein
MKTKNGHEVEFVDVITRRIRRQANQTMLKMRMKLKQDGLDQDGNPKYETELEPIEADTGQMEDDKIRACVLKLDGSDQDIVNRALNLPEDDFNEIMEEINKLLGETKKEQEKLKKK